MNCIVTAGPTFEPLDRVRRLTNFSTGRLGTELANFLTAQGHEVTLLIGESATYPGERRAGKVRVFSTTTDLRTQMKALAGSKAGAVFHAAAVSDFSFGKLYQRDGGGKLRPFKLSEKISTRAGNLMVELVPTPKIIAELRGWFPQALLCGWKFEANGGRPDALRAAERQMAECATDCCVANGPAYGKGFCLMGHATRKHFARAKTLFVALERLLD